MKYEYTCANCTNTLIVDTDGVVDSKELCEICGATMVLLETETPLKTLIHKAVASGHRGCKAKSANPTELINKITASVVTTLESKGLSLADAGVKIQIQRLQQDLDLARRKKNEATSKLRVHSVMLGFAPKSILSEKELEKLARMDANHPNYKTTEPYTYEGVFPESYKDCRP